MVAQYERYKVPFSLILLDIDDFKRVNDIYGHQEGDYVLAELSNEMQSVSRKSDFIYRFGGEEFMIIAPNAGLHSAEGFAEKLRAAVQRNVHIRGDGNITISLGGAEITPADNVESLIKRADANLYSAKHTGKK